MRKVKIITDSCADLPGELLDKYDIDFVKMNTVLDGVTTPADLRWTRDDQHKFYDTMRAGNRILTTQVPMEEFNKVFRFYLEKGYDIVYIACCIKQTASVNTGAVVAKQLVTEYPDSLIECIDSLNSSLGEGMVAIEAAKLAKEGKSVGEIKSHVLKICKTIHQYVAVHTLDYFKRAGRVKGPAAFFGNLMGVKPIITIDVEGNQAAYKKVKGRKASIEEVVNLTKDAIVKPEEQTLYVVHSDCAQEEVDDFVALLKKEIPCKDIIVGSIGPIVGASVGPDTIGVYCFGKPVTFSGSD